MRLLALLPILLLPLAVALPTLGAPVNDALANTHALAPRQSRGDFVALTTGEIARIESLSGHWVNVKKCDGSTARVQMKDVSETSMGCLY
jgi:hypothetical protein